MEFTTTHQLHQESPEIALLSCTGFFTLLTIAHLPLQVLLSIMNLEKYYPSSTVSQNPFNLFTLPTCECGWSNDSFQGAIHTQAIHAPETSQEGDKSMGTGRCNEWICIHVSGKQGNTAEKGTRSKCCNNSDKTVYQHVQACLLQQLLVFSLTFMSQVCTDVILSEPTGRVFLSS